MIAMRQEWEEAVLQHQKYMLTRARELREDLTREERHLWYDYLRYHPVHWYKQRIIEDYIVDFYCASAKLVIELDGSQHFEPEGMEKDAERTAFLEQYDLKVIRITNREIHENFRGVCEYIDQEIRARL